MSDTSPATAGRFDISEWPLRRKIALAVAIPMLLAAVFGGLRVQSALAQAANYNTTANQVTVLAPAVDYVRQIEKAVPAGRVLAPDDKKRDDLVAKVSQAADELKQAAAGADLTSTQQDAVTTLLELQPTLENGDAFNSINGAVSQVRAAGIGLSVLIDNIVSEQVEPEPQLVQLGLAMKAENAVALQLVQVANADGRPLNPIDLFQLLGAESSAIESLASSMGQDDSFVLELRKGYTFRYNSVWVDYQNPTDEPLVLGGAAALQPYERLSVDLLGGIDDALSASAAQARTSAIINAVATLLALLLAVGLAVAVSRLLLNSIRRVRDQALEVAHEQLPATVRRIRDGGEAGEIEPISVTTHEEMGQLARAVDELHETAVRLAADEADLRAQVGQMFVTLSRRNTSLINQQLALIENLEHDEKNPRRLESLFRLDHLASRMRRTAESLMILADAPTQPDAGTVSVTEAVQAATAGVQDYQRVELGTTSDEQISPIAVGDVVHLLTELIDNALAYSPPSAPVAVAVTDTVRGQVIEISDGGLGMARDDLERANADLKSGGEITPETARRMGLLVASRIAKRHGISVSLDPNGRGGITAVILLPPGILPDRVPVEVPAEPAPEVTDVETVPAAVVEDEVAVPEPAKAKPAVAEVDRISAAINAAMHVGQAPGSTPPLPQRTRGAAGPQEPTAPEPVVAETLVTEEEAPQEADAEVRLASITPLPQPAAVDEDDTDVPAADEEPETSSEVVDEPAAETDDAAEGATTEDVPAAAETLPAIRAVPDLPVRRPALSEDDGESPIFRSLQSSWLNRGGNTAWATREVDEGWQAAARATTEKPVEETPETDKTTAGLPMRRPGGRLVPGGVAQKVADSTPARPLRDPEAIRARLAAHRAGVNRGRHATSGSPTDPTTKEA